MRESTHSLIVQVSPWSGADAAIVCHAEEGAVCRLNCPEGCESWNVTDHHHELIDYGKCLAAEWFENVEVEDTFVSDEPVPIHHGMAVFVEWADGWRWTVTP